MNFDNVSVKDLLDWTVPIVFTWVGQGVRKYLKQIKSEMQQAKDSVIALNVQIAKMFERVEYHGKELDSHESRIQHVEHRVGGRKKI